MIVKKFTATTLPEAMNKIRTEFGIDAVIMHQKKIRKPGITGIFGAKIFEVTAAIEDSRHKESKKRIEKTMELDKSKQQNEVAMEKIFTELNQMKDILGKLTENNEKVDVSCSKELETAYSELSDIQRKMLSQGIKPPVVTKIMRSLLDKLSETELHDPVCIERAAEKELIGILGKVEPLMLDDLQKPKIIALVGPTGVGKTTTIAKLAANFALYEKKDVMLITADTYRIAAQEQLKTYGDIMNLPVNVVFTPSEFAKTVEENKHRDLIILDTAGRSQKNTMHLNEIKGFIDAVPDVETFLCISLNTKMEDINEIVEKFKETKIDRYIFTKADETNSYGSAVNVIHDTGKAMSYLTNGQDVPDDIEIADLKKIAKLILKEC